MSRRVYDWLGRILDRHIQSSLANFRNQSIIRIAMSGLLGGVSNIDILQSFLQR